MSDASQNPARIVLRVRSATPSRLALEAAVQAAHALERRLSGFFIENSELMSLASLSCAREVTFGQRANVTLTRERVENDLKLAAASAHRELRRLAALAGIDLDFDVVRGDPVAAIDAPVEAGALLALGEPFNAAEAARLSHFLNETEEVAGALMTGPRSRLGRGPVIVAVEEASLIPSLLGIAARLPNARAGIVILLIADTRERLETLGDTAKQLPLPSLPLSYAHALISRAAAGRGSAGMLAEAVIRYQGSFAIAHLGRLIRARERELQTLAQTLECPLLLLK